MLKSLPSLVTTSNLNDMLAAIEKLPTAVITRTAYAVAVRATKKTGEVVKVLGAISADGEHWSVQAAPGLVSVKESA